MLSVYLHPMNQSYFDPKTQGRLVAFLLAGQVEIVENIPTDGVLANVESELDIHDRCVQFNLTATQQVSFTLC